MTALNSHRAPVDAQAFADDWIDAFNSGDIDRILAHYSETVALRSPLYARFTGQRTDIARGLAELRTYFSALFAFAGPVADLTVRRKIHPAYYWGVAAILISMAIIPPVAFSPVGGVALAIVRPS